jgi:sugar lactone lactonase YvrE
MFFQGTTQVGMANVSNGTAAIDAVLPAGASPLTAIYSDQGGGLNLGPSTSTGGLIYTIAGTGISGAGTSGGAATTAALAEPEGIAVDAAKNVVYIADTDNEVVRQVDLSTGDNTIIAGTLGQGGSSDTGTPTAAKLNSPMGLALDSKGDLFIADTFNDRILELSPGGQLQVVAGNGTAGFSGDNGQATAAALYDPMAVAVDTAKNVLYIADTHSPSTTTATDNGGRVRAVDLTTGVITTVAGTGVGGYNGDNIAATAAQVYNPRGVAVDNAGHLFISDTFNDRIRQVDLATGKISTIAGTGQTGLVGDNGPGTSANVFDPSGLAFGNGNLYIADTDNNAVRSLNLAGGTITTVVGTGAFPTPNNNKFPTWTGNVASAAVKLGSPWAVTTTSSGNLFVASKDSEQVDQIPLNVPVAKAVLTITANNGTAQYGSPIATPGFTATGFVNGEGPSVLSGSPSITVGAQQGSSVGTYPVTISQGTLAASNYTFNFMPGSFTITPAPLTLTANTLSRLVGMPNPTLTFTASGFVNSDTAANLTTQPTLTTTATTSSATGDYAITISGATSPNYTITFVPGTLHVLPTTGIVQPTSAPLIQPEQVRVGRRIITVASLVLPLNTSLLMDLSAAGNAGNYTVTTVPRFNPRTGRQIGRPRVFRLRAFNFNPNTGGLVIVPTQSIRQPVLLTIRGQGSTPIQLIVSSSGVQAFTPPPIVIPPRRGRR